MRLCNILSVEHGSLVDLDFTGNKIVSISETKSSHAVNKNKVTLNFENALVFPGLINSHDHFDFNCFPQLGNKKYQNYVEWGNDIHAENKEIINAVLNIPKPLRERWGVYKNLLNGITSVVNHGPKIQLQNLPISVFQNCQVLHSIQLEKYWKLKLNNPLRRKTPVVIHIGEGTDSSANAEIDELIKWNFAGRDLIGVHGIAMHPEQAISFKSLVWCPASNYFLMGETAKIDFLKDKLKIVFGTDSTVSASWNIWEHLSQARATNMVSDKEIFEMLTINAAKTWKIHDHGILKEGNTANLVVARKKDESSNAIEAFFAVKPEDILLILHNGEIRLFDSTLLTELQVQNSDLNNFYKINLEGSEKYVWGNLPALINEIKEYYPQAKFPVN